METLTFTTTIKASAKKVWDIMTSHGTYEEWTGAAFPGSTFEGEWKKGARMRFMGPEGSGTLVEFVDLVPAKLARAVHRAVLLPGGKEDRESEMAKGWIGTTEDYTLTEKNGTTEFVVEMKTTPAWKSMFEESWPKILAKLKEICEK